MIGAQDEIVFRVNFAIQVEVAPLVGGVVDAIEEKHRQRKLLLGEVLVEYSERDLLILERRLGPNVAQRNRRVEHRAVQGAAQLNLLTEIGRRRRNDFPRIIRINLHATVGIAVFGNRRPAIGIECAL